MTMIDTTTESLLDGGADDDGGAGGRLAEGARAGAQTTRGLWRDAGWSALHCLPQLFRPKYSSLRRLSSN